MTQAEKKMKKYVNAVERRLNLPLEIKARVMSDFQSSIAARREAGQTDEDIYAELGTPAKAAADLSARFILISPCTAAGAGIPPRRRSAAPPSMPVLSRREW